MNIWSASRASFLVVNVSGLRLVGRLCQPKAFLFDELSQLRRSSPDQHAPGDHGIAPAIEDNHDLRHHDQVEAMTMADKIVVLDQGNIEQVGSPLELYRAPDNLSVAASSVLPK